MPLRGKHNSPNANIRTPGQRGGHARHDAASTGKAQASAARRTASDPGATSPIPSDEDKRAGKKESAASVARAAARLLIKVFVVVLVAWALFTFVFGLFRVQTADMSPAIKDGDLVMTYRLDQEPQVSDVIAFDFRGQTEFGRVVARAGDTVDIADDGLRVNGSYQQESGIYSPTTQFEGGVDMPLTVPDGQVFVLGDNRTGATDSRIIGCIPMDQSDGVVIGVLRRHGF